MEVDLLSVAIVFSPFRLILKNVGNTFACPCAAVVFISGVFYCVTTKIFDKGSRNCGESGFSFAKIL